MKTLPCLLLMLIMASCTKNEKETDWTSYCWFCLDNKEVFFFNPSTKTATRQGVFVDWDLKNSDGMPEYVYKNGDPAALRYHLVDGVVVFEEPYYFTYNLVTWAKYERAQIDKEDSMTMDIGYYSKTSEANPDGSAVFKERTDMPHGSYTYIRKEPSFYRESRED